MKLTCNMCGENKAKYVMRYDDGPFFLCAEHFTYYSHGQEQVELELIK